MAHSRPSISVVDDDRSIRKALRRLLRSTGHRVEVFATAEEFLADGVRQQSACLILDVRLPGMSGLELQTRLAASGQRIPIVFITGHEDEPVRRQAIEAGAIAFLCKPFDEQSLLEAVDKAIGQREERSQLDGTESK